jgi:DNA-binding transcriptional ArsR family regulator
MSAHLAILSRAGIVTSEKTGRTVVYRAATGPVEDASRFLAGECANGGNLNQADG